MPTLKKILIRMPNWLGDAIMATPILLDVKARFPNATLTLLCKKGMEGLFIGNPAVDEICTFIKPNAFLHRIEHRDVIEKIKQGKWDLGILLTHSFSSAWWFYRGKVKERIGFKGRGRTFILTKRVSIPKSVGQEHLVTTYKRLLAPLAIPLSQTAPTLYVLAEEKEAITQLLKEYRIPSDHRLVGINPGAAYGPAKCWPKERYRKLVEKILDEKANVTILVFGDPDSAALSSTITQGLGERIINLAGRTTLRQLIAFIDRLSLFITNDSGPMHIAASLKTPLIALFGSTSDVVTGPYQHGIVIHKHVTCSPCFKRVCPIDFRCMNQISVEEVYKNVNNFL